MTNLFDDTNFEFVCTDDNFNKNFPTLNNQFTEFRNDKNTVYNGNGTNRSKPFNINGTYYDNKHFFYTPFRVLNQNFTTGEILDTNCFTTGADLNNTNFQGFLKGFDYFAWWARASEDRKKKNECVQSWHAVDYLGGGTWHTELPSDTKILRYTSQEILNRKETTKTTPSDCYFDETHLYKGNIPQLRNSKYFYNETINMGGVVYQLKNIKIDNLNSETTQFRSFQKLSDYNQLLNYSGTFKPRLNSNWIDTIITPKYLLSTDGIQLFNKGNKYIEFVERTKNLFIAVPTDIIKDHGFITTKTSFENPEYKPKDDFITQLLKNSTDVQNYYKIEIKSASKEIKQYTDKIKCDDLLKKTSSSITNQKKATNLSINEAFSLKNVLKSITSKNKDKNTNSSVNNTNSSVNTPSSDNETYTNFKNSYQIKDVELRKDDIPNYYNILKGQINSTNTPYLYKLMDFVNNPTKHVNTDFAKKICVLENVSEETINQSRNFLIDVFNKVIHTLLGGVYTSKTEVSSLYLGKNKYFYDFLINSYYIFYLFGLDNWNFGKIPNGFQFIPSNKVCDGTDQDETIDVENFVIDRIYPKTQAQPDGFLPTGSNKISYKSNGSSGFTKNFVDNMNVSIKQIIKPTLTVASRTRTKDKSTNTTESLKDKIIVIEYPLLWLKKNEMIQFKKSFYMRGLQKTIKNANPCACNCGKNDKVSSKNNHNNCSNEPAPWTLATMVACFFPWLSIDKNNYNNLKKDIKNKIESSKDWFNSTYENYKISSFDITDIKIYDVDSKNYISLSTPRKFVFDNGFCKNISTNTIKLAQCVNTLSDYYVMSKEGYNSDRTYWLTYEGIRKFGLGKIYDHSFNFKKAVTIDNSYTKTINNLKLTLKVWPDGTKKEDNCAIDYVNRYYYKIPQDAKNGGKMQLILPDDRLVDFKNENNKNIVYDSFKKAGFNYLYLNNQNLAYNKNNNSLILYAYYNIDYDIINSLSNSTNEGHIQPFTTNRELWFCNDDCLKDIITRYSSSLNNQLTTELKFLINSNPQTRLTYNFYKLYQNKFFDLFDGFTNLDLYNINFGPIVASNNSNILENKYYFGETSYANIDSKKLSRYQIYHKYGKDENEANFYDYITNIWDNVDIFTLKESGDLNSGILVNLPSNPTEYLGFIYENFDPNKYSVINKPLSDLCGTSSEWLTNDYKNVILLSEKELKNTDFTINAAESVFNEKTKLAQTFNFPCFNIKLDNTNNTILINFNSKKLYLYYKPKFQSCYTFDNCVQLTAITEETV